MKNRVTGIGGIFFKTKDPDKTKEWYKKHLGLNTTITAAPFGGKTKTVINAPRNGALLLLTPSIFRPAKKNS